MSTTVYRTSVPVDGRWHDLPVGRIVHVDCRQPDIVEAWWMPTPRQAKRRLRVFGTGQPIPTSAQYVGTALTPATSPQTAVGSLVWHLFEDRT